MYRKQTKKGTTREKIKQDQAIIPAKLNSIPGFLSPSSLSVMMEEDAESSSTVLLKDSKPHILLVLFLLDLVQ
jgi:hypothetical protein